MMEIGALSDLRAYLGSQESVNKPVAISDNGFRLTVVSVFSGYPGRGIAQSSLSQVAILQRQVESIFCHEGRFDASIVPRARITADGETQAPVRMAVLRTVTFLPWRDVDASRADLFEAYNSTNGVRTLHKFLDSSDFTQPVSLRARFPPPQIY